MLASCVGYRRPRHACHLYLYKSKDQLPVVPTSCFTLLLWFGGPAGVMGGLTALKQETPEEYWRLIQNQAG
jgi:uncharacterized protein YcgL (UPF0745 family)